MKLSFHLPFFVCLSVFLSRRLPFWQQRGRRQIQGASSLHTYSLPVAPPPPSPLSAQFESAFPKDEMGEKLEHIRRASRNRSVGAVLKMLSREGSRSVVAGDVEGREAKSLLRAAMQLWPDLKDFVEATVSSAAVSLHRSLRPPPPAFPLFLSPSVSTKVH